MYEYTHLWFSSTTLIGLPKTAVGLFRNSAVVEDVARAIESPGFPHNEVRRVGEPVDLATTGVTSVPHLDFEVALTRELMCTGATRKQADAYADDVRHQAVLVFTIGSEQEVDKAAAVMNRYGARQIEESTGPEPQLPQVPRAKRACALTSRLPRSQRLKKSDFVNPILAASDRLIIATVGARVIDVLAMRVALSDSTAIIGHIDPARRRVGQSTEWADSLRVAG